MVSGEQRPAQPGRDRAWASPEAARARATELLGTQHFFLLFNAFEGYRKLVEALQARSRLEQRAHVLARMAHALSVVESFAATSKAEAEIAAPMQTLNAALQKATSALVRARQHHQARIDGLLLTDQLDPHGQGEDRLRRAIVRDAINSLRELGRDPWAPPAFSPAGLAYFAIAVGLDAPPSEKTTKDERWSAALAFKNDYVKRWQRILRSVRKGGQEA
jgi:hypothetical protein